MARLTQLRAVTDRCFGSDSGEGDADRLLTLIDDVAGLLAQLRAERDEIGVQMRGSMTGRRADDAYRASAGLGRKQK